MEKNVININRSIPLTSLEKLAIKEIENGLENILEIFKENPDRLISHYETIMESTGKLFSIAIAIDFFSKMKDKHGE